MRFAVKTFCALVVCFSLLSASANAQCSLGQCELGSRAKNVVAKVVQPVAKVVQPVVRAVQNRPKVLTSCGLNLLSRTRSVVRNTVSVLPRPFRNSRFCR